MGEASVVEDVVVNSIIRSTENFGRRVNEIEVPRVKDINIIKRDYKSVNANLDTLERMKERIQNEFTRSRHVSTNTPLEGEKSDGSSKSLSSETGESMRTKKLLQAVDECVDIPAEVRELLSKLLLSNESAFFKEGDILPKTVVEDHYIYLIDENKAVHQPAMNLAVTHKAILMMKVKTLVDMGVLVKCT